ncbi:hypothetical protein ACH47B_10625 [Rhodococcus sp. NPDC019627]|uniref:hypothetical protein n=1 Tax=unclassified Rhodococcus (in: high G+C Gram-positive bacteria) TaxID=192944 RepID=UPI0034076101
MTPEDNSPYIVEPTSCEIRPWSEIEYHVLLADSDRLLAEALTPQAVVLLGLVTMGTTGSPRPLPLPSAPWTPSTAPIPEIRAKQRSPPT